MKKGLTLALSLFSSLVFADPTVFGMELGKTTENELKSLYSVNHLGVNKYSHGNMYSVPTSSIKFDDLQEVTTIFDSKNVLIAVLTKFPKSKFDYLNNAIGGKYALVNKKIPFVGDKSATYRDGDTEISLNAPHMGFGMSMNYIRDDLMRAFNKQNEAEKQEKTKNESSQL
ncbi:TPA: hypothetical protein KDZ66_004444 [Vibrio vulnificus]|nr:hypothetical protein [Vibrio vulnificus]